MELVTKSLRPGMPCELDIFYEENDGFSEHINDTTTYKLVLITAGSFVFEEDGEYRTVTAPAGLMLNERMNFHVVSEEGVRTRSIVYRNNRQVEIYKDPFVAKVASYLWLHMDDEITLPGILRKFSVNKNQLNDAFNKEVGMSCMNYLERLRINWAKNALQYNFDSIPISEISRKVGYSDTNYFSKVFKKYTGMTPTEFQKNMEDLR